MDLDKILKGVGEIAKDGLEIKRLNTPSDYKDPWLQKGKEIIGLMQEKRQLPTPELDLGDSDSSVSSHEKYTSELPQADKEKEGQRPHVEAKILEHDNSCRPIYYSSMSVDNTDVPTRLDAVVPPGAPTPPDDMQALWDEIQDVASIVRSTFSHDGKLIIDFFKQLHVTAQLGLVGPAPNVSQAQKNISHIKRDIARQFPSIRGHFWKKYLSYLIASAAVLGPIGTVFLLQFSAEGATFAPAQDGRYHPLITTILAFVWIPVGVTVGIFLEFIFRIQDNISFEKLETINPGRWRPLEHFANTTITAYSFAAIMAVGAFQVGVANVLLNDFASTKPWLSIAVGFVAGFAYPYVRDLIFQFKPVKRD